MFLCLLYSIENQIARKNENPVVGMEKFFWLQGEWQEEGQIFKEY